MIGYLYLSQSFHDDPDIGLQSQQVTTSAKMTLIPNKKRCGEDDKGHRFSEPLTYLEELTKPFVPKTLPRERKWDE